MLVGPLQSQNYPFRSVLDFGGDNTGIRDNTIAYLAALTDGGEFPCVYFPGGKYEFATGVAFNCPSSTACVTIKGDGPETTQLSFGGTDGLTINLLSPNNSVHVRDLSILATSAGAGNGLAIVQTAGSTPDPAESQLSDITNVTLRGSDGLAHTNYWSEGISVSGASCINFTNVFVSGPSANLGEGVFLFGTTSVIPVVFNFVNCIFNNLTHGVNYGNFVQGVAFSQCNFTFCQVGIVTEPSLSDLAQLAIIGCQFNCSLSAILLEVTPSGTMIANNFFIAVSNSLCINLTLAGLFTIVGNTFFGIDTTNTNGIQITSSSANGVITGNAFVEITNDAIALLVDSSNVNVQSNTYQACGTNVANAGSGNTIGGGSS